MEGTMTTTRKQVIGESGLCSSGAAHHLCRGQWETPSCFVTCGCGCHKQEVTKKIVAKKSRKLTPKVSGKVLVPKK